MGQISSAKCKCGYRTSISTGGSMSEYMEKCYFPFYCKDCGLVSINYRITPIHCPDCESVDVKEYGKHPISIESTKYSFLQCFNYGAPKKGNLCPECKEMTLEFQNPEIFFD